MQVRLLLTLLTLLSMLWTASPTLTAQTGPSLGMETFINQHVQRYAVSPTNRLRVSAYTELRGEPEGSGGLRLNFGQLGELTFYQRNCLLRTSAGGVHHIAPGAAPSSKAEALNEALDQIFEQMLLLSNGPASQEMIAFVDEQLARKTIDPFHKIYARYLLLHHGQYDPVAQTVVVKSAWLQGHTMVRSDLHGGQQNPLTLRLDAYEIRGFYHRTYGEVFLHDADRAVAYATGEQSRPNVAPFKSFLQKMMGHLPEMMTVNQVRTQGLNLTFSTGTTTSTSAASIEPMYHEYNWIPMMLGLLRERNLSFGDPEIVCYFVEQPYFDRIYAQLTVNEKHDVDAYLHRMPSRGV